MDRRWRRRCGPTAAAGALALTLLAVSAMMTGRLDAVAGGWTWPSATFAVLEGPAAVGFSLWALAWFRRRWDRQGPLTRWAGRASYAAYVLHPPVLVLISLGRSTAAAGPGGQVRPGRRRRRGGVIRRRGRG
ncbi:MAG TPA: acyltransferase family protein, partial [Actinomycetes bacterium]|nr:acyltransferase family protein [Actinomycetes bacterium]